MIATENDALKASDPHRTQSRVSEETMTTSIKKSNTPKIRKIYVNQVYKNKAKYKYKNNFIKTSQYNFLTFLPLSILIQFKRWANIYFLVIGTLQAIPQISSLNPATVLAPLGFLVLISIIREGIEDFAKYRLDKIENSRTVHRYRNGKFNEDKLMNIEVGDIVMVKENECIPADLLLLACSNESKLAFLETSSLDGEKNLKARQCIPSIYRMLTDIAHHVPLLGKIICESPNADLGRFNGKFILAHSHKFILDIKNFLHKGTFLKNTEWALGVVLYTGNESKIILNSHKDSFKQSKLERDMNRYIMAIFLSQSVIMTLTGVLNTFKWPDNDISSSYLSLGTTTGTISGILVAISYLLLHNNMIPITTIVCMEVSKFIQGFLIDWDIDMFSKKKGRFAKCNTCCLTEELGQLKYLFSDKTGTLTQNKLKLRAILAGDELYGINETILKSDIRSFICLEKLSSLRKKSTGLNPEYFQLNNLVIPFIAGKTEGMQYFNIKISSKSKKSKILIENQRDLVNHFLRCMALNHSCFLTKLNDKDKEKLKKKKDKVDFEIENDYRGENPDEIVLVKSAQNLGVVYNGGDANSANLLILHETQDKKLIWQNESYELLKVLEFSSERGCMSVVVKRNNQILLLSKGSDKAFFNPEFHRLKEKQFFMASIQKKAQYLSEKGLRLLYFAMKLLDPEEWKEWITVYETKMDELIEEKEITDFKNDHYVVLEQNLILIGLTAVEDKLQERVPETIKDLQLAGINIWVLTGDNFYTAQNIGIRAKLLSKHTDALEIYDDMKKFQMKNFKDQTEVVFNNDALSEAEKLIADFEIQYQARFGEHSNRLILESMHDKCILYLGIKHFLEKPHSPDKNSIGIITESRLLNMFLFEANLNNLCYYGHPLIKVFLDLALKSNTVICCRISPKLKASIVKFVKKNIKDAICGSVGDGQNDVSMIHEANVGIGIYGNEGTQAAMASDFAIGDFKSLRRLILFHGRINYVRIAEMCMFIIWKGFLLTVPQFYFSFYCGWSAQSIYDDWQIALINNFFTFLPIVFKTILEIDILDEDHPLIHRLYPFIYYIGRENEIFNLKHFLLNILYGFAHAAMLFFWTKDVFFPYALNSIGDASDLWAASSTMFTAKFLVMNFRLLFSQRSHTLLSALIMGISSFFLYGVYLSFMTYLIYFKSAATYQTLATFPYFFLMMFLFTAIVLLYEMSWNFVWYNLAENPVVLLTRFLKFDSFFKGRNKEEVEKEIFAKVIELDNEKKKICQVQRVMIPNI